MGEKNLSFRISAQDDTSAVTSKIAQAAKRDLGQVEDSIDDARTAGKKMADALTANADELADELRRTASVADQFAEALGPDLQAKLNDGDLDKFVNDLRKAGLTFDDIEGEVDELAAALKRIDEVQVGAAGRLRSSFDDVGTSVKKTGDEMDRTGSVTANFVGNAAQDLPGVSGSFGALNVAAGQFAEYAAEGGIGLKQFATAIGPIAAATILIGEITKEFQKQEQMRTFRRDQVEDWTAAIREGRSAISIFADEVDRTGKLLTSNVFAGGETDLVPMLGELGVSLDQFIELSEASREEQLLWRDEMIAAGGDVDTVVGVIYGAITAHENLATAEEAATITTQILGGAHKETGQRTEETTRSIEEQKRVIGEWADAVNSATGNQVDLRQAQLDTQEAIEEYTATLTDAEATDRDKERAGLDLIETFIAEGEAAGRAAEDAEVAAGRAATAQRTGVDAQIITLQALAGSMAEGSPVRVAIEEHIAALQRTAGTYTATVTLDTSQAVEAANALRRELLGIAAGSHEIDFHSKVRGARAAGGPVQANAAYVVGENGPELFVPGSSGAIIPNGGSGSASMAAPTNITINVNAGWGADGRDIGAKIVDELVRFERSNGSLPITVR